MRTLVALAALCCLFTQATAQTVVELPADAQTLVVREALAIQSLARGGRSLIVTDPIEASIVRGTWSSPTEGQTIQSPDGRDATWQAISANDDGLFTGRSAAGYLHVIVRSPAERIVMLHARGHRHVFVNGQRRGGDVYNLGITALPILLQAGDNELLFRGGRGQIRIELKSPESDLVWLETDHTKPHAIRGKPEKLAFAVPIANASNSQILGLEGETRPLGELDRVWFGQGLGAVAPLGVRKVGFLADWPGDAEGDQFTFRARVVTFDDEPIESDFHETTIQIREPGQRHDRTFISDIDHSVQYYAVTPRSPDPTDPHGLILTLHGASVEARNQAAAYAPKPFATIVAPTNRRPFGFDWEDWGRLDAIEVLRHAEQAAELDNEPFDPTRRWLTGHSMGGHGTWQVGAHFAPHFAAIGPSAGWRDFWSYGGAGQFDEADPIGQILNTANNASRTLLLEQNYKDLGVYILHGDADDNVPVSQARFMRERLGAFHTDFAYYEQPGAGHWWGNQCVDWPPMMRFFDERTIDPTPATERFTTINPAISSQARLFTIYRQAEPMTPTSVEIVRNADDNTIVVTTQNVLAFALEPAAWSDFKVEPATLTIDGQSVDVPLHRAQIGTARYQRSDVDRSWEATGSFDPAPKGAHRAGPFKHAFNNDMAFVYATGGTPEENAWALAKARYDADTWQYRANGSVDVLPDTAFDLAEPSNANRNVILYGCADSHRLWDQLLGDAPVRIARSRATVGDKTIDRDDLAAFFTYPRAGSDTALVGVVAGTGSIGRRLADEPRYFISGVGYPDWMLMTPEVLESGLPGIIGAGFFASDWSIDPDHSAWRD